MRLGLDVGALYRKVANGKRYATAGIKNTVIKGQLSKYVLQRHL
jgi:hypothetical protein